MAPLTGVVPLSTSPVKAAEVTVSESVAVAVLPDESVTCTVSGAEFSPALGVPVMAPEGASVRPTALSAVPEVTVQV